MWVVTVTEAGERTHNVRWDGRIPMVAQVPTHGRFVLHLTRADEPPLVAGDLRLLFTKRLAVA